MSQIRHRPLRTRRGVAASLAVLAAAAPVMLSGLASAPGASAATAPVTIDGGSYATDASAVTLSLTWPSGATSAIIANDDAFDAAGQVRTVQAGTGSVTWSLPAPSADPKPGSAAPLDTVYVEFVGAPSGDVVDSAHIVLDTSVPVLSDAALLPAGGTHSAHLQVVGSDAGSGITAVQTSTTTSGGVTTTVSPPTRKGYANLDLEITPASSTTPQYARAESASGEWSAWIPVTPELTTVASGHANVLAVAPNNAKFVLRGFDYQPISSYESGGKLLYNNVTFSAGSYQPTAVASALSQMAKLGYNSLRVFVNPGQIGATTGSGLNAGYVSRMANYISRADADHIRVLLCTGQLPTSGGYMPKANPYLAGTNAYYLNPADITAKERYLGDLVSDLRADGAPLSDVLWELVGEQDWDNTEAPLNLTHRVVQTAAGSFNMASATSKVAMENANLLNWINTLSSTMHRLLPGSLVGAGIYAPSINAKRPGWTVRPAALFGTSSLNNFVDIHVYSNLGSQLDQMESFGAAGTKKVLIMGEFGAARSAFSSAAAGAAGEVAWQQQSCRVSGMTLSGWLLWTWNSSAQAEYWTALDGNGAIEQAMSPKARPNPCT